MNIRHARGEDVEKVIELNRSFPSIAQHPSYLVWCLCTLYASRTVVAEDEGGDVYAYILSLPMADPTSEFLLQAAIKPNRRSHGAGSKLLGAYYASLREQKVLQTLTSVHRDNAEGMALVKQATFSGVVYAPVPWPATLDPLGDGFLESEQLLAARL
jgi:hypothetical protein